MNPFNNKNNQINGHRSNEKTSPLSSQTPSSSAPIISDDNHRRWRHRFSQENNIVLSEMTHQEEQPSRISFWSYLLTNLTDPCCGTSTWMYQEQQDDDDDFSLSQTEVENAVHVFHHHELGQRMASF